MDDLKVSSYQKTLYALILNYVNFDCYGTALWWWGGSIYVRQSQFLAPTLVGGGAQKIEVLCYLHIASIQAIKITKFTLLSIS